MDITFINVGYGEAILITCEGSAFDRERFVMLIDGGSNMDKEYTGTSGRIRAIDFLRKKGIDHIDIAVFSHVHEDHTNGLMPILAEIPADRYWTSIALDPLHFGKTIIPNDSDSDTNLKALASINAYSKLMGMIPKEKVTLLDGILPGYYRNGDLTVDILGPEDGYKRSVDAMVDRCFLAENDQQLSEAVTETTEAINNASLILRLHYKGRTVLLCGDTNAGGYAHILAADPELLRSDVFKIGHHGQADSVSAELVKAVDPSVIVCCASNDYRSNSSNEKTFETIRDALGEKPVTYLFQDGLYNEKWNADISPRNGVTVRIGEEGISWELEEAA